VRDGRKVPVHLNGGAEPEISGETELPTGLPELPEREPSHLQNAFGET